MRSRLRIMLQHGVGDGGQGRAGRIIERRVENIRSWPQPKGPNDT